MKLPKDEIMKAGFDHPCRQTCSGWQQGRERGVFECESRAKELEKALEFYGNEVNWSDYGTLVLEDCGEKARLALKNWKGE